jgi:hypothetical protein
MQKKRKFKPTSSGFDGTQVNLDFLRVRHSGVERKQNWTYTENQGCERVIALDPGVRTFLSGYSPDGVETEFAPGDVTRLCRLAAIIDRTSTLIWSTKSTGSLPITCVRTTMLFFFLLLVQVVWSDAHAVRSTGTLPDGC